jgi:hypothetical protein
VSKKHEHIHLASHAVFAGIIAHCGRGMQGGSDEWSKDVNYWGKDGITKTKGIKWLAFSPEYATCPACLRKYELNKGKIHAGASVAMRIK